MTEHQESKLEIDWLRTAAGALAAVSSAVALSTLGAAGTLIGAALGSVIITVGGALYSHGLSQSRRRLAEAQTLTLRKIGVAQAEVRRASRSPEDEVSSEAHLAHADERLEGAKTDLGRLTDESGAGGWGERLRALPWRRVSLVAAGLFLATVLAITAFELLAGKSVSQLTGGTDGDSGGGTTISRIGGGQGGAVEDPADEPADQEAPVEEEEPAEDADPDSEAPAEESPAPAATPTELEPELPVDPSADPPPE